MPAHHNAQNAIGEVAERRRAHVATGGALSLSKSRQRRALVRSLRQQDSRKAASSQCKNDTNRVLKLVFLAIFLAL